MSRFFQNFEDEQQEAKKKTVEIIEKSQEKLSKRDQKLAELQSKIEEVVSAKKTFEKLFKKFMNDLKKYTQYFAGSVPDSLVVFFNDERIKASKPMQSIVDGFLAQFKTVEETEIPVEKKVLKRKTKSLDSIMCLDDDKKEKELVYILENDPECESKGEILISLFSIYSREKNPLKMIEALRQVDLDTMKSITDKIDIYLGKVFDALTEEAFSPYNELLSSFEKKINNQSIQKRLLQFQFFKLNETPENTDSLFTLLYFTRKQLWSEAFSYYTDNTALFDSSAMPVMILSEFADLAAKNGHFVFSFDLYLQCYEAGLDVKLMMDALCVILNIQLIDKPYFQEFLESFKSFDSNYLCLPSSDPTVEVHRAFYSLCILDYKTAESILESTVSFTSSLEQSSVLLYHKQFVTI
ncbi:hypothetical protein GINT2_001751 [Glugoides intestinalis]